jgi:purine-nucleoside phosphorylase
MRAPDQIPGGGPAVDPVAAAERLRQRLPWTPEVLLVLGSGLGPLADRMDDAVRVSFTELPGHPPPGVQGHAGRYVAGVVEGHRVLAQQGRFHLYEGHAMEVVGLPVRTAHELGVRTLVVTNAAGGIRRDLTPGSLLLIDDHVNLQYRSPLIGPVRVGEVRFPDMSAPYDPSLQALAERVALREGIRLTRGVYAAVTGPAYETPAEIRMLERMGVDVVGMSTVPEILVARALGMCCLGLSLVTNHAAGISPAPLDHAEVVEVGRAAGAGMERLVRGVLAGLPRSEPRT